MLTPVTISCRNACMKGKWLDASSGMCKWCPLDSYQNSSIKFNPECIPCPDQKKTIFPGAESVAECYDPCSSGTFQNTSSGSCQDCPIGSYMDSDKHAFTKCKTCNMGKTTRTVGSKESNDCYSKCTPGHFYNSTKKMCSPCPEGKYQEGINKDTCKDCPAGKTTRDLGSKSLSACITLCGAGQFLNNSIDKCDDCPMNTYENLTQHRSSECKPCGLNKITQATGKSSISQCVCSKGWYLDKSVSQCKKCSKGKYQDQSGQEECKQCPGGKSTVSDGQTNELSCLVLCTKGEFFDPNKKECNACPYGEYQEVDNHFQENCEICPSKKTTVGEGADDPKTCIPAGTSKGDKFETIKLSLRFVSLTWSEELKNKNNAKYQEAKQTIEAAIRFEFRQDPSFEAVEVTNLRNGSIIAEFDLQFNDKADYKPIKTLQDAVQNGKVGNLTVSPESFKILHRDCSQPLGMENGQIKDEQITASTYFPHHEPYEGRLNAKGGQAWYARYTRVTEYLQIDFRREVNITAVATQGQSGKAFYVTEYKLNMSDDGKTWKEYRENDKPKVFKGNDDSDTIVRNNLASAVRSRIIRFLPQEWNEHIYMRVEVYGCLPDDLLLPTKPTTDGDAAAVTAEKDEKWPWGAYLGIVFAILLFVGVVVAVIYWKKKSKDKKRGAETDEALMGVHKCGDGEYRVIKKNAADPDEDDENVV